MKIVLLANYYNHHLAALAEHLAKLTDGDFCYIETKPMDSARIRLGWQMDQFPGYVKKLYEDEEACLEAIRCADVVITGNAPERLLREAKRNKKLIFRYSERIYKKRGSEWQIPLRVVKYHFFERPTADTYLLCASAFSARDYALSGNYINKTLKWGYFPAFEEERDLSALLASKKKNSILFVARMIDWKHPEVPIELARRLRDENIDFEWNMIGTGPLEDDLQERIKSYHLEGCVHLLGSMPFAEVRESMKKSSLFVFTSDRNEGWGAVLNEAMNSACCCIACDEIGAAPYLIKNKQNGVTYRYGDMEGLYQTIKLLLEDDCLREEYARRAYQTIAEEWNAAIAAERLVALSKQWLSTGKFVPFEYGVCSRAKIRHKS